MPHSTNLLSQYLFTKNPFHPLFVCTILCLSADPATGQASFSTIGDLPGGIHRSEALALSGDGSTIVGKSRSDSGSQVFRWRLSEGMVPMPLHDNQFPLIDSNAGVSYDGSSIIASSLAGYAVRWNEQTGYQTIPALPGYNGSFGIGISDDGNAAVGSAMGIPGEAFYWNSTDGVTGLGSLRDPHESSVSLGISGNGQVAVGWSYSTVPGLEAFRWTQNEGMVGLGDLPGGHTRSYAHAASYDGSVIVGQGHEAAGFRAFIWSQESGMTPIGDPGLGSIATDVSADGKVVVGTADQFGAFVWTQTMGMRSIASILADDYGLDLQGWSLDRGIAISADGSTIIGDARKPTGEREVFIATIPVPSPGSFVCLALGGVICTRRYRAIPSYTHATHSNEC